MSLKKQKKDGLTEMIVVRTYKCLNSECGSVFTWEQKACKPFTQRCPACKMNELILDEGHAKGLYSLVGVNKPKTVGALAERNTREQEKITGKGPTKRQKINLKILKNPSKYIEKGHI